MKKIIVLLFSFILSCLSVFAESITIKSGTVIPFQYDIEVNSKKIMTDDQIPITVVRDVIFNGKIIFQRGAKGYLVVFDAKKVRTWHVTEYKYGGYIDIEGGFIQDVTGQMREIAYKKYEKGRDLTPITTVSHYGSEKLTNSYNTNRLNLNAQNYGVINLNGQITGSNVIIQKFTRDRASVLNDFVVKF